MTESELARVAHHVEQELGVRVEDRLSSVERAVEQHARGSVADLLARIEAGDRTELRAVATQLTVGETYFFRHVEQLRACVEQMRVLGRRAAILSAGCSTGEEPYSLAILFREAGIDASIHAVDVNPRVLERARRGRYSRWSMRVIPPEVERAWFIAERGEVVLSPEIRKLVTFEQRNLVTDDELWTPGRWDVVMCRNVLMYFTEGRTASVIDRIARALVPGGLLFLGHAEALRRRGDFELCQSHGTFYYRRTGGAQREVDSAATSQWAEAIEAAAVRVKQLVDGALETPPSPLASPVLAAASPAEAAASATERARELIGREQFADARRELAGLEVDRDVLLLRAIVETQLGAIDDAEAACRALLAIDERHAGAHYLLGLNREAAGDLADAATEATRAARLDPTFAMPHLHLGLIARRIGQDSRACDELELAIKLLEREPAQRLSLFGGGFGSSALIALCRSELRAAQAGSAVPR